MEGALGLRGRMAKFDLLMVLVALWWVVACDMFVVTSMGRITVRVSDVPLQLCVTLHGACLALWLPERYSYQKRMLNCFQFSARSEAEKVLNVSTKVLKQTLSQIHEMKVLTNRMEVSVMTSSLTSIPHLAPA